MYIYIFSSQEGLIQLRTNLQRQLEMIRGKQKEDAARSNKDEWVVV